MGSGSMKENNNIYFKARKKAALYDERLFSRERAAEMLGVHPSTLADYELGATKVVPVDKVVLMSDLYNAPELKASYCKYECPIGGFMPLSTEIRGIEGISLRLIKVFNTDDINALKEKLIEISADGTISESEKPALVGILNQLDSISQAISELKLAGEKYLNGKE